MKVVILEDEPPALAQVTKALRAAAADVEIVATFDNVMEAGRFFDTSPPPDLVVSDIQLADGSALPLFSSGRTPSPVVFATAYDRYVIDAFHSQAIDYLLKPIDVAAVARALEKYRRFESHFGARAALTTATEAMVTPRRRIVARKGAGLRAVAVDEISYVRAEEKLTLLVLTDGSELLVDKTLTVLEAELDPEVFFRLNRQLLVHVQAVRAWRSAGRGRILVSLEPRPPADVVVAQESAAAFRAFMDR